MNHKGSTFLCGCAPFGDLIFFSKELDELKDEGTENSSFFMMDRDVWNKYESACGWTAVSIATIKPFTHVGWEELFLVARKPEVGKNLALGFRRKKKQKSLVLKEWMAFQRRVFMQ